MPKYRHSIPLALAIAALSASFATAASAAPGETPQRSCFHSLDWEGWTASSDGDALYLRVGRRDVYRVGLTPGSRARKDHDDFLINQLRGSRWICAPLDLDLMVSNRMGFQVPLIARSLRKLTPEEIAALPPKDVPR